MEQEHSEHQPLTDEQRIQRGIAEALNDGRSIDHATARCIASQIHGGQGSALCSLASSGAISDEVWPELSEAYADASPENETCIDALEDYCLSRGESDAIPGWGEIWPIGSPHQQIGSVDEMGWFGIIWYEDQPGGVIYTHDKLGFRRYAYSDSSDELNRLWLVIHNEYAYFRQLRETPSR